MTEEKNERPLGFCGFRQQPCSNRCQLFVQGMGCCVMHCINANLGSIKQSLEFAIGNKEEKK